MDRTALYNLGDTLTSSMERLIAQVYAWMWGISLLLCLVWFVVPTATFYTGMRVFLMTLSVTFLSGVLVALLGMTLKAAFSPSSNS